jgi:hypothetical protein
MRILQRKSRAVKRVLSRVPQMTSNQDRFVALSEGHKILIDQVGLLQTGQQEIRALLETVQSTLTATDNKVDTIVATAAITRSIGAVGQFHHEETVDGQHRYCFTAGDGRKCFLLTPTTPVAEPVAELGVAAEAPPLLQPEVAAEAPPLLQPEVAAEAPPLPQPDVHMEDAVAPRPVAPAVAPAVVPPPPVAPMAPPPAPAVVAPAPAPAPVAPAIAPAAGPAPVPSLLAELAAVFPAMSIDTIRGIIVAKALGSSREQVIAEFPNHSSLMVSIIYDHKTATDPEVGEVPYDWEIDGGMHEVPVVSPTRVVQAVQDLPAPDHKRLKMLPPAKFSGDRDADVNDSIFTFETYLSQSGFPRTSWANYAMSLLEKQALTTYISYAQPLGRPITWDEFKACLLLAYAKPDRELAARKSLFGGEVKHTSSVADYLRRFRQVVARCGTSPDSQSLRDLFWQNLKSNIREKCRIDPLTGRFWTTFEAMSDHCVMFDSQNFESPVSPFSPRFKGHHSSTPSLKAANVPPHAQGRKSDGGQSPLARGGPGGRGGGRGGGRDSTGSGRGRGAAANSGDKHGRQPPVDGVQCKGRDNVNRMCTAIASRGEFKDHIIGCPFHSHNKQPRRQ